MKSLIILLLVFINFSCISKKNSSVNMINDNSQMCPENGVCNFEILKNKSLELVKDGIGMYYPKITDAKSSILKFEFIRGEIANVPDSGITEVVYIEIGKETVLSIKNGGLKQVKASYGRLCFCRGESGYFPIVKGELNIKSVTKTQYEIEFHFEVDEVPQALKQFKIITEL